MESNPLDQARDQVPADHMAANALAESIPMIQAQMLIDQIRRAETAPPLPLDHEDLADHLLKSLGGLSDSVDLLREALKARDARQGLIQSHDAWQRSLAIYQAYALFVGLKDQVRGKEVDRANPR